VGRCRHRSVEDGKVLMKMTREPKPPSCDYCKKPMSPDPGTSPVRWWCDCGGDDGGSASFKPMDANAVAYYKGKEIWQ
jgi:hypothetical protein